MIQRQQNFKRKMGFDVLHRFDLASGTGFWFVPLLQNTSESGVGRRTTTRGFSWVTFIKTSLQNSNCEVGIVYIENKLFYGIRVRKTGYSHYSFKCTRIYLQTTFCLCTSANRRMWDTNLCCKTAWMMKLLRKKNCPVTYI